jgi:hypothetical protein
MSNTNKKEKSVTYKSLDNKMDRLHFLLESSYISMQSFHLYQGTKRHFLLEEKLPVVSVFVMIKITELKGTSVS